MITISAALAIDQKISLLDRQAQAFGKGELPIDTVGLELEHAVADGLDRQARGDLAGQRAPHPVRDGEQ